MSIPSLSKGSTEESFRTLKPTIFKPPQWHRCVSALWPGPVHSETRNEVPQESSVEPADINAGKAENTNDDYRTVEEQSGRNRKGWKFFIVWTGGGLIKCGTDPVSNRREIRLDSRERLEK